MRYLVLLALARAACGRIKLRKGEDNQTPVRDNWARPARYDEAFDPASRAEDVAALDEWLYQLADGPAPPPRHWAVRGPGDLDARENVVLKLSNQKGVNASRLPDGRRVVVKALRASMGDLNHGGAFEKERADFEARADGRFHLGLHGCQIAYYEILYMEFLRGQPGVPVLFGGWWADGYLVWVVSYGGTDVGAARGARTTDVHPSDLYDNYARHKPLELARAWFRCFRSFAERGGFVLTDFKPPQFVLDRGAGGIEITLVDGPTVNTGPPRDGVKRLFARWNAKFQDKERVDPLHSYFQPGLRHLRCKAAPAGPGGVYPPGVSGICAKRTYEKHGCMPVCCHGAVDDPLWGRDGATCADIYALSTRLDKGALVDARCRAPGAMEACAATCGGCPDGLPRSVGAPELNACVAGYCAPFDYKVHVLDAAGKFYILPRIVARAHDKRVAKFLKSLMPNMLAPEPAARPSFSQLLYELDRFENRTAGMARSRRG